MTCKDHPPQTDPGGLELSRERFETILASISDGVFTINDQGRITCFNRAAQEMTGFSFEEAIGSPCHEIFQAEICADACALRYTIETGRPVANLAIRIRTKDGETIPVSISTAVLRDKKGRVIGGVETFRDLRQIEVLRRELIRSYHFQDIVSKSAAMRRILDKLETVAASDTSVLITGESGTGKELVARAIHNLSHRRQGPFVALNCGGLPENLVESELFGHEAGAFTGAVKARQGRFRRAHGGTLFLDEIGELPLGAQVKLLRALEEKQVEPLGASRPLKVDVRILAATNRDLDRMVRQGEFREDLFYRIDVIRLDLPPLRQRREDIPLLAEHFVRRLAVQQAKEVLGFTPAALKALLAHDYPGNVRELKNIVEHGFVLCPGGLIGLEHLPGHLQAAAGPRPIHSSLEEFERRRILQALENQGYNRQAAARELGIHKTTLFRKLRKYGIELPPRRGRKADKK